jgi:hypothetical protein
MPSYQDMPLITLLLFLVILWGIGFLPQGMAFPNIIFLTINGRGVTFWDFVTPIVIVWIIGLLPHPFHVLATVLLLLWLLSLFSILPIPGLSSLLILSIIAGLAFYLVAELTHQRRQPSP